MRSSFISSRVFTLTTLWLDLIGEVVGADSLSDSARIHHCNIYKQKTSDHNLTLAVHSCSYNKTYKYKVQKNFNSSFINTKILKLNNHFNINADS